MQGAAQRTRWVAAGLIGAAALLLLAAPQWRSHEYRKTTRALLEAAPDADKVWAHRVNSLGALDEAKDLFAGVEADVVFELDTKTFRVRHPPAPDSGLSLDEYLAQAADRPQLRLWLDWKNPTPGNLAPALAELSRLDGKYRIRRRALVETPSGATFAGIEAVSRQGFLHGYYLPTERALKALQQGPGATAPLGAEIRTTVERGGYGAVTYDARLQPFVDQQLSGFLEQRNLRRFSWDMRIDSADPTTSAARLSEMTRTRGLDALLISFPSRFRI